MSGFTAPPAFGAFRVLHQIGSGVLGPVFRTYDPQRDRLVAVKAFRLDIIPEQVAKLAESLRRLVAIPLTHPNLVPAIDAGLEGTTAYLASEYITAETLDVALRQLAPAPLERVEPMLAQMAEAIDAAWAAGVGHGALHPRDVFLTVDTNAVRVAGFGVVPALESIGIKTSVRRTYAAPERLTGGDWDIRADIYTLGAIAHELLTRRRPAGPGEQDGALTTSTTAEQRVLIRRVLAAALAERPEHRFASARAFANALGAIVRGEPIADMPEGAPAATGAETLDGAAPIIEIDLPSAGDIDPSELFDSESESTGDSSAGDRAAIVAPSADGRQEPVHENKVAFDKSVPASQDVEHDGPVVRDPFVSERNSGSAMSDAPAGGTRRGAVLSDPPDRGMWGGSGSPTEARDRGTGVGSTFLEPQDRGTGVGSTFLEPTPVPWLALVAVGLAGIALGLVIGFQWGRRTMTPVSAPIAVVSKPADTDVPVNQEPPRPAAAATEKTAATDEPGRIVVRSTPPGAMLLIDGHPRGQTPATVKDLSLGVHTIDVARPGFVPYSERVTLSLRRATYTAAIVLRPGRGDGTAPAIAAAPSASRAVPTLGSIYVDSRPRGAHVMIDGRLIGNSPVLVPELRPGDHTVQLDLEGHLPFSTHVAVKAGEQARVAATLAERNNN